MTNEQRIAALEADARRLREALAWVRSVLNEHYMSLPRDCAPGPPKRIIELIDAALSNEAGQ